MSEEKFVVVETEYGPVKGIKKETIFGQEFINFQGIPYMKPPVGKLRFRDAQPPEKWTDPLDATIEGSPFCSQDFFTMKSVGDLNAMFVNVFCKDVDPKKPAPVMVFIHGGGFVGGSSRTELCGPDYLMQKNIVLVTLNYRLGVFGFLSLIDEDLEIPGNAGLKDQTFALKWVKINIANFGGDPDNITLFGQSAGGASVHYHLISEHSKGLFQRAIPMSGTAFNKTWTCHLKRNMPERLAKLLGWDEVGGEKSLLKFLEEADPYEIVEASSKLMNDEEKYELNYLFPFGPTVEPYMTENCFIPEDPVLMARKAWGNDIDIIIGGCSNEGLCLLLLAQAIRSDLGRMISTFAEALPPELKVPYNSTKAKEYGKLVKKFYYGCTEPSVKNFYGYSCLFGDLHFWYGIYRAALSRAANGCGKTFVYRFDATLDLNLWKMLMPKEGVKFEEASHGDDIPYLFKTMFTPPIQVPSKEFELIKRMLNIYTNFATTGNPGQENWESLKDPNETFNVLNIGNEKDSVIESPAVERYQFWNDIYDKENCPIY